MRVACCMYATCFLPGSPCVMLLQLHTAYKCSHEWHGTGPLPQSRQPCVTAYTQHYTVCGTVWYNAHQLPKHPRITDSGVTHVTLNGSHLTRCFSRTLSTSHQSSARATLSTCLSLATLARTHMRPGTAQHSTVCAHRNTTKHRTAQSGADAPPRNSTAQAAGFCSPRPSIHCCCTR